MTVAHDVVSEKVKTWTIPKKRLIIGDGKFLNLKLNELQERYAGRLMIRTDLENEMVTIYTQNRVDEVTFTAFMNINAPGIVPKIMKIGEI